MYLHKMRYITFILGILICSVKSLPPVEFIREFAVKNQRSSVVLHVPNNPLVHDYVKW